MLSFTLKVLDIACPVLCAQVGAEVVLGDRDQEVTVRRLMFRAAQLAAERARARRTPLSRTDSDTGQLPANLSFQG